MSAPPDEPGGTDDRTGDSPEPFDSRSTDEAFEAIVAGIRHGDPPPEVPVWPAIEDASPSESPEPEPEPAPALGSQWTGWEDVANHDEEVDADQDGGGWRRGGVHPTATATYPPWRPRVALGLGRSCRFPPGSSSAGCGGLEFRRSSGARFGGRVFRWLHHLGVASANRSR